VSVECQYNFGIATRLNSKQIVSADQYRFLSGIKKERPTKYILDLLLGIPTFVLCLIFWRSVRAGIQDQVEKYK
jgi:hypothetical protein